MSHREFKDDVHLAGELAEDANCRTMSSAERPARDPTSDARRSPV